LPLVGPAASLPRQRKPCMSGVPIIEVKSLSKAYRIWEQPSARLKSPLIEAAAGAFPKNSAPHRALTQRAARGYRDFYALRDVSFTVRRGEATGIIGRNGSGKSTLLQLIAGTLTPTAGTLEVNGRVSALLELGSGFNPEFTGRENVFLNGAIYGLSRPEMEKKFEEIAAFAEIGDFIDQPVKTYSSGMMVRLAFAVGFSVQPDILIIDEALSVGDVFFQQKCFKKLHDMLAAGTTLLFVSHDTVSVRNLCEQVVLLDQGRVNFIGAPDEAVSRYFALFGTRVERAPLPGATAEQKAAAAENARRADAELKRELVAHNLLPAAKSRHGNGRLELVAAVCENEHGAVSLRVEMTRIATFRFLLRAHDPIHEPSIGLNLYDRMTNLVFAAGTRQLGLVLAPMAAGEERIVTFKLTCNLQPGEYTFSVETGEPSAEGPNFGFLHDKHEGLGPLAIHYEHDHTWPFYGIARLPLEIAV
jgi:lipopolysaccharide transport system ATP-binding protein